MARKCVQDIYRPCKAMLEASISDPTCQEGIDFCIERCPYTGCIIAEPRHRPSKTAEYKRKAREFMGEGLSIKQIAEKMGKCQRTVYRYLVE